MPENKKAIKKLIRSVIPNDVSDIYDEIRIDNSQIVNASPFYSVIQIHTIEEMKLLFLEGLYQKWVMKGLILSSTLCLIYMSMANY